MIMKKLLFICLFLVSNLSLLLGQSSYETVIDFPEDEYWWGGVVGLGSAIPYIKPVSEFDLS